MRSQSLKNKQIAFDAVNKKPVGFYMAIPMLAPFATQRMVSAFRRQLLAPGENGNYFFESVEVFTLLLGELIIFLKLIRPVNLSQRLSSLKSASTFAALCRPRPFLEFRNVLAVSSSGISTSKGMPRRRIICRKYRVIASDIERPRQSSIFLACSLLFASILVFNVVVIFILPICCTAIVHISCVHIIYVYFRQKAIQSFNKIDAFY